MDEQRLAAASGKLQQQPLTKSKRRLLLIIGIIIGIVIVVLVMIAWFVRSTNSSSYPYIPAPVNTIKSTSFQDLCFNMMMDSGEPAIKYSVISRLIMK